MRGCRVPGGAGWACPRCVPGGALQGSPGSGPAAGGRAAARSGLEAGGAALLACAVPWDERRRSRLRSGALGQYLAEGLGGGPPAEGLAGPGVELGGDGVQVSLAVPGQIGALGKVLAQQPIGVLVAAALPRRVRAAEIDGQVSGQGD